MNIGRFKYNFNPPSRTLFSATFNIDRTTSKRRSNGSITDSFEGDYSERSFTQDGPLAPSLDLFLRHVFNDRNSLEVQLVGTLNTDDYRRNNTYIYDDGRENSYVMDVNTRRRSLNNSDHGSSLLQF